MCFVLKFSFYNTTPTSAVASDYKMCCELCLGLMENFSDHCHLIGVCFDVFAADIALVGTILHPAFPATLSQKLRYLIIHSGFYLG